MKVLTLHQPWASLVVLGAKTIETRSWSTQYRGPLAIHAASKVVYGSVGDYRAETWFSNVQHVSDRCYCDAGEVGPPCDRGATRTPCLTRLGAEPIMLPLGAIIATCTLVDVVPIIGPDENPFERYPCVQTFIGFGEFPDGWLELYHPTMGNSVDPEGCGRSLPFEAPYGDFAPGRFAWLLADIVPVNPPVPFKGGQGLTKTWEPA